MQTKLTVNWMSRAAIIAGALAFTSLTTVAFTAQRPISDFVSRQGAYCLILNADGSVDCEASGYGTGDGCFLFLPPTPNFTGFSDPNAQLSASVDYAGLMNETFQSGFHANNSNRVIGAAFRNNFNGRLFDAFPAEHIRIQAAGR